VSGKRLGFVATPGISALLGMSTKNAVILNGQIESAGQRRLGGGYRCEQYSVPTYHAHRGIDGPRLDPIAPTVF